MFLISRMYEFVESLETTNPDNTNKVRRVRLIVRATFVGRRYKFFIRNNLQHSVDAFCSSNKYFCMWCDMILKLLSHDDETYPWSLSCGSCFRDVNFKIPFFLIRKRKIGNIKFHLKSSFLSKKKIIFYRTRVAFVLL